MELSSFKSFAFKPSFSVRKSMMFWYQSYRWFFIFFFVVVMALGGWKWYQSLYHYTWTETQKQEFLKSYAEATDFRSNRFETVIKGLDERSQKNAVAPSIEHDLFRLDAPPEKDNR